MKIFVLGTADNRGGAAQISWELRKRLKKDGHTVSTFVRYKYSKESDVFLIPRKRWQDWLVKIFANDLRFARTSYLLKTKEFLEADIVHCHNLHSNFFDLKLLQNISERKPVIWTIHDLWALTGYANDSITRKHPNKKKFLLYLWDTTPRLLKAKEKIYKKSRLFIVAVSEWMKKEAENGILKSQDIIRIYNGIDETVFKPHDKASVRRELGLPVDKKIISFCIKGWQTSEKVVNQYAGRDDVFFLSIGHSHVKSFNKNILSAPHTTEKTILAKYLAVSDLFFYPTQGDSFGLIVAEALSCGVPVVAYGIDAMPELVQHKETGYIAQEENLEDAKRGIEYVLGLPRDAYEAMRKNAREYALQKFTLEKMYAEYLELYRRVLSKKK